MPVRAFAAVSAECRGTRLELIVLPRSSPLTNQTDKRFFIFLSGVRPAPQATIKKKLKPTAAGDWTSAGTISKGEYGVPAGLVFGYPCKADGKGNFQIVDGLKLDAFGKAKFDATLKELLEERDAVKDLIPS